MRSEQAITMWFELLVLIMGIVFGFLRSAKEDQIVSLDQTSGYLSVSSLGYSWGSGIYFHRPGDASIRFPASWVQVGCRCQGNHPCDHFYYRSHDRRFPRNTQERINQRRGCRKGFTNLYSSLREQTSISHLSLSTDDNDDNDGQGMRTIHPYIAPFFSHGIISLLSG